MATTTQLNTNSPSIDKLDPAMVRQNLFAQLVSQITANSPEVGNALGDLADSIWKDAPLTTSEAIGEAQDFTTEMQDKLTQLFDQLGDDKNRELVDGLAKLGHLDNMAKLIARDNFFEDRRSENKPIPGGLREWLDELRAKNPDYTAETVIDLLNKPTQRWVFTAHPTNVNSQKLIETLRDLSRAAEKVAKGQLDQQSALDEAFAALATDPVTPQTEKNGHTVERNLTPREETQQMLYYLDNSYHDVLRVFKQFDEELGDDVTYNPLEVKPDLQFASWGSSGDKDGNSNINANTTLHAALLHRQKMAERYVESLDKILPNNPAERSETEQLLAEQKIAIATVSTRYLKLLDELNEAIDCNDLPAERFDALLAQATTIDAGFDFTQFQTTLETLAEQEISTRRADHTKQTSFDPEAPSYLNLLRRTRIFGKSFGDIQFRETAELYAEIIGELDPQYKALNDETIKLAKDYEANRYEESDETKAVAAAAKKKLDTIKESRARRLTAMLRDPDIKANLQQTIGSQFDKHSGNAYHVGAPGPIAYHTFKRMQIAGAFGDMFNTNVLAECEHDCNFLEAQLLQEITPTELKGKSSVTIPRPEMHVVPLFENPDVMQEVGDIMKRTYENPQYTAHQERMAVVDQRAYAARGMKQPQLETVTNEQRKRPQHVQIAHSDNARRSGLSAARGFIHRAHEKIRQVSGDINIKFFEGGSLSDSYRGGERAISATINKLDLHGHYEQTVQGGDLLNYFNAPGSIERLVARNLVHQAKHVGKETAIGNVPHEESAVSDRQSETLNNLAIDALSKTLDDYRSDYFNNLRDIKTKEEKPYTALGKVMYFVDYLVEKSLSAVGSRSTKRGGGASNDQTVEEKKDYIEVQKIRTISFSETNQGNLIHPAWFGAKNIAKYLSDTVGSTVSDLAKKRKEKGQLSPDEEIALKTLTSLSGQPKHSNHTTLQPKLLHELYKTSPVFRDVIDRIGYGLIQTDWTTFDKLFGAKLEQQEFAETKAIIADMKKEYRQTAYIVHSALSGKLAHQQVGKTAKKLGVDNAVTADGVENLALLRRSIQEKWPHLQHSLENRGRQLQTSTIVKRHFIEKATEQAKKLGVELESFVANNSMLKGLLRANHAFSDTAIHGRETINSDIRYQRTLVDDEKSWLRRKIDTIKDMLLLNDISPRLGASRA